MFTAIMSYRLIRILSEAGLLLIIFCYADFCFADKCVNTGDCKINVSFTGTYMEETCGVSINNASSSETITLPVLSTTLLQKAGAEAGSQQFSVTLTHCPIDKSVMLRFVNDNGFADVKTGNLINESGTGYSENVQVRLRKANGTQMIINDETSTQEYVIPATGDDITHYYIAAYYAAGAGNVTPGEVGTLANIDIIYK
ncbi:fimbrial protein [Cronobacter turicensis]